MIAECSGMMPKDRKHLEESTARILARHLIETEAIPGLKGFEVVRSEVTRGDHQFDFLLRKGKRELILDVIPCTPAVKRIATYPHEATDESERVHLEDLAGLTSVNTQAAILFISNNRVAEFFIPDFHTDFKYTQTLLELKDRLNVMAVALRREKERTEPTRVRPLKIPWKLIESEAKDRGSYMVVLKLPESRKIKIGSLKEHRFEEGFYVYVGSAKAKKKDCSPRIHILSSRIDRHRQQDKGNPHWHIDYLRPFAEFCAALPIRTKDDLECKIADSLRDLTGDETPDRFGSTDCRCQSHLFYFPDDPLTNSDFKRVVQYYRFERLVDRA